MFSLLRPLIAVTSLINMNAQHPRNRWYAGDPLALLPQGLTKLYGAWLRLTYPFASLGRNVSFHFTSKISRQRAWGICLGNSVSIGEHAWLNVATDDPSGGPVGEPTIVIEDGSHVGSSSIISGRNRVHIESDVLIGQHVIIQDHSHAYEDLEKPIIEQGITKGGKIRIGKGSWIGRGAAILCSRGELTIGRHCVVSANSVVMRSIPDYSVVFGMPAMIIRQYDPEKRAWRMGQVRSVGVANRESIVKLGSAGHETELLEKS
jgi:acetyltransferase-like isoleucine patch superfamily enzyme